MSKFSRKGFTEFVNSKPANQVINHLDGDMCAMGLYIHDVTGKKVSEWQCEETCRQVMDDFRDSVFMQMPDLYSSLLRYRCDISTYGELSGLLNEVED